jgi:hypothetical protein
MKKLLLFIVLGFILSGCASSVPGVKIADIDFDNAVTPEGEKLYCKKEAVTGTHRKTMTCLTKAEMAATSKNSGLYYWNRMRSTPQMAVPTIRSGGR